jgi:DNA primase
METQRVDFPEALRILARQAGVEIKPRGPQRPAGERELQEKAMQVALRFFREELARSPDARAYCDRRGLDAETLDRYGIGYAPAIAEALPHVLQKEGIPLALARDLYLVDQDAGGGYFARFRGRLMFPIHDARGEIVAFGGRLIGDGQPKYINSSDTPLFRKSRTLYGFHHAKDAIAKARRAVLVEGYLDVIACHRAGVPEAVASLGTALTDDHAKLIARWADRVAILYDADPAGVKAADRAADILEQEGLAVAVSLMPAGEDPDTLSRTAGPERLRAAVAAGISPIDFRVKLVEGELDPGEPEYWKRMVETLAKAPSELEIEKHLVALSGRYPGLRDPLAAQRALRRQVLAHRRSDRRPGVARAAVRMAELPVDDALHALERAVLAAALEDDLRMDAWRAATDESLALTSKGALVMRALATCFPDGAPREPAALWLAKVEPEEARAALADAGFGDPGSLNERTVADAIAALDRRKEARAIRAIRPTDAHDDDALLEIQRRAERLHPKRNHGEEAPDPFDDDPAA